MKRIVIVATLIAFAQMASGFSPMPQTFPGGTTLRRIQVNAQTITALAPGKNYVVDLTQRGVVYEFSPQAGQIDFSRVRVRTAQGEVAIDTFIEKTLPKDKLAEFKYKSQAFGIATRPPGTLQNPSNGASKFCSRDICTCFDPVECTDLLNNGPCGGPLICDFHAARYFCYCTLNP